MKTFYQYINESNESDIKSIKSLRNKFEIKFHFIKDDKNIYYISDDKNKYMCLKKFGWNYTEIVPVLYISSNMDITYSLIIRKYIKEFGFSKNTTVYKISSDSTIVKSFYP